MILGFLNNRASLFRGVAGSILLVIPIFLNIACAKRSRAITTDVTTLTTAQNNSTSARINLNTASAQELEGLPGIGSGLAERIIEYRQKYGAFSRPEHLIMVRGISEHRFQAIRDLITVE